MCAERVQYWWITSLPNTVLPPGKDNIPCNFKQLIVLAQVHGRSFSAYQLLKSNFRAAYDEGLLVQVSLRYAVMLLQDCKLNLLPCTYKKQRSGQASQAWPQIPTACNCNAIYATQVEPYAAWWLLQLTQNASVKLRHTFLRAEKNPASDGNVLFGIPDCVGACYYRLHEGKPAMYFWKTFPSCQMNKTSQRGNTYITSWL